MVSCNRIFQISVSAEAPLTPNNCLKSADPSSTSSLGAALIADGESLKGKYDFSVVGVFRGNIVKGANAFLVVGKALFEKALTAPRHEIARAIFMVKVFGSSDVEYKWSPLCYTYPRRVSST